MRISKVEVNAMTVKINENFLAFEREAPDKDAVTLRYFVTYLVSGHSPASMDDLDGIRHKIESPNFSGLL